MLSVWVTACQQIRPLPSSRGTQVPGVIRLRRDQVNVRVIRLVVDVDVKLRASSSRRRGDAADSDHRRQRHNQRHHARRDHPADPRLPSQKPRAAALSRLTPPTHVPAHGKVARDSFHPGRWRSKSPAWLHNRVTAATTRRASRWQPPLTVSRFALKARSMEVVSQEANLTAPSLSMSLFIYLSELREVSSWCVHSLVLEG